MISFLVFLALFLFICSRIQEFRKAIDVSDEWQERLSFHISTQQLYESIEEILISKKVDFVKIRRVNFFEDGWPSRKREYLYISRKETCYLVYGFPMGTEYYIGYKQGVKKLPDFEKGLISFIPLIGPLLLQEPLPKTYFQSDTEKAFKDCVFKCITQSVEIFKSPQGYRSGQP